MDPSHTQHSHGCTTTVENIESGSSEVGDQTVQLYCQFSVQTDCFLILFFNPATCVTAIGGSERDTEQFSVDKNTQTSGGGLCVQDPTIQRCNVTIFLVAGCAGDEGLQ